MTLGDAVGSAILWLLLREVIAFLIVLVAYAIGGAIGWQGLKHEHESHFGAAFAVVLIGWLVALAWEVLAIIWIVGDVVTIVNIASGAS